MVKLNIMQSNIRKGLNQTDDLINLANNNKVDIICVQEPYIYSDNNPYRISDRFNVIYNNNNGKIRPKALIAIDKKLKAQEIKEFTSQNIATAITSQKKVNYIFLSLYLNLKEEDGSDREIENDLEIIQKLITRFKKTNNRIIICTDSNCRAVEWGDNLTTKRAMKLIDLLNVNNLVVQNLAEKGPTFEKKIHARDKTRCSYIDLTITDQYTDQEIIEWNMFDEINTEHKQILIKIDNTETIEYNYQIERYDLKKIDWTIFENEFNANKQDFDNIRNRDELEDKTAELISQIQ